MLRAGNACSPWICGEYGFTPTSPLVDHAFQTDGTLITHSRVRMRLALVWLICSKPSIQLQPSHQADDIGIRADAAIRFLLPIQKQ
jgi:hypothetical protein